MEKILDENYFKETSSTIKSKRVEDFLREDERILWRGKPKKSAYVIGKSLAMMPIGLLWGAIDFGILFGVIFNSESEMPVSMLFVLIPFFALHLTPFWIWLYSLLKSAKESRTLDYVITNQRILIFKGNPKYIDNHLEITELFDSTCKINFIDRFLRVGDLTISSVSGKTIMITDIPKASFIHNKILGLCKKYNETSGFFDDSNISEFYDNKYECTFCGTFYDKDESKCPSCGSSMRK